MSLRFIWDEEKAATNRDKHRVSFQEAQTVFYDPLAETNPDFFIQMLKIGTLRLTTL